MNVNLRAKELCRFERISECVFEIFVVCPPHSIILQVVYISLLIHEVLLVIRFDLYASVHLPVVFNKFAAFFYAALTRHAIGLSSTLVLHHDLVLLPQTQIFRFCGKNLSEDRIAFVQLVKLSIQRHFIRFRHLVERFLVHLLVRAFFFDLETTRTATLSVCFNNLVFVFNRECLWSLASQNFSELGILLIKWLKVFLDILFYLLLIVSYLWLWRLENIFLLVFLGSWLQLWDIVRRQILIEVVTLFVGVLLRLRCWFFLFQITRSDRSKVFLIDLLQQVKNLYFRLAIEVLPGFWKWSTGSSTDARVCKGCHTFVADQFVWSFGLCRSRGYTSFNCARTSSLARCDSQTLPVCRPQRS